MKLSASKAHTITALMNTLSQPKTHATTASKNEPINTIKRKYSSQRNVFSIMGGVDFFEFGSSSGM